MTLTLTKIDYVTVGVTSHGTTRVLPASDPKQTQKFVVGDNDGILHIYGMKKGEMQLLFKSLPGPEIKRVVLGGTLGMPKDKIFVARGHTVQGYSRKGKLFLEFDTSLIEPITALYVLGPDLAACARDVYHRYRECKDADSYLAGEKLLDVVLLPAKDSSVYAILACSDCAVRVLQGTKGPIVLRLSSIPTVLALCREGEQDSMDRLLIGTINGKIGLLIVDGAKTLRISWLLQSTGSEITCLDTYELQDGLNLLVGRQDGYVEVYSFSTESDTTLTLRHRHYTGESISTVVGGKISSPEYPEVLVTTYSGRIFGLSTKPPGLIEADQNSNALGKLKLEILQLEEKLNEEKEMSNFSTPLLTPLMLAVNHRMVFNKNDSSYLLSIELDMPIDNILIQSDTPLELLDVETSSAVVSLSACDPKEGNYILATYRCQLNTSRLDIRLRTIEGQSGTLQIYVTSQIQPKCCRKIRIPLCALSLHSRVHTKEEAARSGPFNELKLTGCFSVAEMHAWLALILPDVPERPYIVNGETEATLTYCSSFTNTILKCAYRKGSAIFHSESISTILTLRDVLTKEGTKRKTKLDVSFDISENSITRVLELIFPRLQSAMELQEKITILNALEEWEMKENPEETLCTEYQQLLKDEPALRAQKNKDVNIIEQLQAVIIDLYVDWKRAKGTSRITSQTASEILNPALKAPDLSLLIQIFTEKDLARPSTSRE